MFAWLNNRKILLAIIFVTTILSYSNILTNGFAWDDPDFYKNWPVLYNVSNIGSLLTGEVPVQHEGVYRPIRSVLQLLLFQTFGPENATGYHAISLLIHLAGTLAVFLILEKLTGVRLIAFIGALLFGVHPIHTESITYLTTSIDVFGSVLALWSLYAYLRFTESNRQSHWYISIVLAWIAFFNYEIALVVPVLIVLIEWYRHEFSYQYALKKAMRLWPYWLGVLAYLIGRLSAGVGSRVLTPDPTESNLAVRVLTMGKAFVKYIYLQFIPYPQNVFHKINLSHTLSDPKVALSWLAVIALVVVAIVFAKKLKLWSVAILWFFIALAPVSNIVPTGIIMAEKYTYLASVAGVLVIALAIHQISQRAGKQGMMIGMIITAIITAAYGTLTFQRNMVWASDLTLWQATLEQRPDYGRVHSNVGFSYYRLDEDEKALGYFLKAKELEPDLPLIYHNLGNVYDELEEYDEAIENYLLAIDKQAGAETYNYAETYNNLATVYQKIGDLEKAKENYQKAVDFDPNYFRAISNLGIIAILEQDYEQADDYFNQALAINSYFGIAHHGLAVTQVNRGDTAAAIKSYQRSIELTPELADNYSHLASLYNTQGDAEKALKILQAGVAANPDAADLHANLGILLLNNDQIQAGIAELQQALKLNPEHQQAQQILLQIQGQ